ncbi:MAG: hypothetical protein IJB44_00685, partial [Clostridia bacterium]|nr:hypothetical protein [Clostridia bacterium]
MKKTVVLLLMLTLLLTVFIGCTSNENPEKESGNYSQVDADIENTPETDPEPEIESEQPDETEPETETMTEDEAETESVDDEFFWPGDWARGEDNEDSEAWENMQWYSGEGSIPSEGMENFVSLWPNELPDGDRAERLSRCNFSKISAWLRALFLYDFPDPEDYFNRMSQATYIGAIDTFYLNMRNSDENHYDKSVTAEEFKEYVDAVKAVGYNENCVETETSYYGEQYGVSVSIILGNEFPWADDDYRLRADKSQFTDCHIRVQLIDPDYVFDLDAIKEEEYQRWLD